MCDSNPPDPWNARFVKVGMRETWECGSTVNTALWRDLLLPSIAAMQEMRSGATGVSIRDACYKDPEEQIASLNQAPGQGPVNGASAPPPSPSPAPPSSAYVYAAVVQS